MKTNEISITIKILATELKSLPRADFDNVLMFLENNELGEALDTLCSQIFENDLKISKNMYMTIEKIGTELGISTDIWSFLNQQINSNY